MIIIPGPNVYFQIQQSVVEPTIRIQQLIENDTLATQPAAQKIRYTDVGGSITKIEIFGKVLATTDTKIELRTLENSGGSLLATSETINKSVTGINEWHSYNFSPSYTPTEDFFITVIGVTEFFTVRCDYSDGSAYIDTTYHAYEGTGSPTIADMTFKLWAQ